MSRSGLIDAQGKALEAGINADQAGERANRAAYCAHEGKLYVERDQSARSSIYLHTKTLREITAGQDRDRLAVGIRQSIGDLKRVLNIPEYDLHLLKKTFPDIMSGNPRDRAQFMLMQAWKHPEWVVM